MINDRINFCFNWLYNKNTNKGLVPCVSYLCRSREQPIGTSVFYCLTWLLKVILHISLLLKFLKMFCFVFGHFSEYVTNWAIFGTALLATDVVLEGDLLSAGTTLVTPDVKELISKVSEGKIFGTLTPTPLFYPMSSMTHEPTNSDETQSW